MSIAVDVMKYLWNWRNSHVTKLTNALSPLLLSLSPVFKKIWMTAILSWQINAGLPLVPKLCIIQKCTACAVVFPLRAFSDLRSRQYMGRKNSVIAPHNIFQRHTGYWKNLFEYFLIRFLLLLRVCNPFILRFITESSNMLVSLTHFW